MCPQSKKTVTEGRSLSALISRNVQGQSRLLSTSDDGWNATANTVTYYPPLLPVPQVVLHTLVSLNLAQAQLFGPQPSRPTFISNNDRIVDQVLDKLSPTIAQVHRSLLSRFLKSPLSPSLYLGCCRSSQGSER